MKNLLRFSSIVESATGLAAIVIPSIVIQLLLGVEANEISLTISRLAGIALLSLGMACWPDEHFTQALRTMSIYNFLVGFFFVYIRLSSSLVGILLWPVAIIHFVLAVLLFRGLFVSKKS